VSNASRPVAIVYWTVARTTGRLGFHKKGAEAAFPPKKYDTVKPGYKHIGDKHILANKHTVRGQRIERITVITG
jgi:hypothetical protein